MSKKVKETRVADLQTVTYDQEEDRVFVTFEVVSEEYKKLVFQLGKRDDVNWILRGDKLSVEIKEVE